MRNLFINIKKVYKYGKNNKFNLAMEVIGSLLSLAIGIGLPLLAANQIVELTDNLWEQLIYISLIIFTVNILHKFTILLIRKNTQIFRTCVVKNIQLDLSNEMLKMSQRDLESNSTGSFIQRIVKDTDQMANLFTVGMGHLTGFLSNVGVFIAVFVINWKVFMFYLFVTITLTILNIIKTKKIGVKDKIFRESSEKLTSTTNELVRGMKDIKMLNAKNGIINLFTSDINDYNFKFCDMRNVDIKYNLITGILSSVYELLLIMLLISLIINDNLSVALAIALFNYKTNVMINFMEKVSLLINETKNFNISCERVFHIIENSKYEKEKFGNEKIKLFKGNVKFSDVEFSYEDNKVLNKLSFEIKEGSLVGLVGKSGEGKTTIFNLLCKLYNVGDNQIYLDNIDINRLNEESIRNNITIINQSPYIFNMSIKDNLKLVKNNITQKEIEEACELACLKDFVEKLPNKYDTILGEGGIKLSGGERQRLAIARAFIQKTKLILFDEATSALDNDTQSKIQNAISNLKGKFTVIVIAHRLSTIRDCDSIMLINNGIIEEVGTHSELLKNSKIYKKLCEKDMDFDN